MLKRRFAAPVAAIAMAVTGGLSMAAPAQGTTERAPALTCSPTNHCYGVAAWPVQAINGIAENQVVHCLNSGSPSTFVDSEMWLPFSNDRWVEEGITSGYPQGTSPYHFWADSNIYGYFEHDQGGATLNSTYREVITYAGNNSWNLYRDGSLIGTSTSNPGPGIEAEAGGEAPSGSVQEYATATNLSWQNTGGTWYNGWSAPGFSPAFLLGTLKVWWNHQYDSIGYGNSGTCGLSAPVQLPAYTADTADIVRRTKALAAANGEKTPIKIEQVFTTSARAESVNGNGTAVLADAAANASVRVVEVRGSFIGSAAKVPQDAAKPKGSAMLVTFDASSGKLTDWSILKSYVDLGQIGRATPLA